MAGTGLVFVGYLLLHMYGNLKALSGEEAFNDYAEHLRTIGEPFLPYGGLLWIIRVVLIVSLVGHGYAAFALWARAGNARRTKYAAARPRCGPPGCGGAGSSSCSSSCGTSCTSRSSRSRPNPDATGPDVENNPYRLARRELPGAVDDAHLRPRDGRAGPAPHARRLQRHADPRLDQQPGRVPPREGRSGHASAVVIAGGFLIPPLAILFGLIQ